MLRCHPWNPGGIDEVPEVFSWRRPVSSEGPRDAIWNQFVDFLRTILTSLADAFSFLGDHRWAAAIVVLTLVIRTLLLPLAIKQISSMRETQRLQPEVQRLRQKYANDRQRQMRGDCKRCTSAKV